jgi:hypothetical protein
VVDNLPSVGPEKQEKLTNVIRKIFGQIGTVVDGAPSLPSAPHLHVRDMLSEGKRGVREGAKRLVVF